jgi:hypothetical protein
MHFMNEWEVLDAVQRYHDHPILGPASLTLSHLMGWTNRNSDGWAYWPKPVRAAAKLIEILDRSPWGEDPEPTEAEYKAALRPVKAFRTRQGADFEIFEISDEDPPCPPDHDPDAWARGYGIPR